MADIRRYMWIRHLRSEPTFHVLRYRKGRLAAGGRGLSFWFHPLNASVAEIPVDTRELPFLIHGQSADFQDVAVQGDVSYRITDPERLAGFIDFSVDLRSGAYLKEPLDRIASIITGQCQQVAIELLTAHDVRAVLALGTKAIKDGLESDLKSNETIRSMGIEVLTIRVSALRPATELEKALGTPTRERIQQEADQSTFERRALAVEKERAISENELQNQIELAKKEESLIDQQGRNALRRAEEQAAAESIEHQAMAKATRLDAEAQSDRIRMIEGARVVAEKEKLEAYRNMSPSLVVGLAAQTLATKLTKIEHLNVTPDLLAAGLSNLLERTVTPEREK